MKKQKTYFENLFDTLCNEKDEQEKPIISVNDEELKSSADLKDYMFVTLESNMQYDFNIKFDDEDVIKFANAVVTEDLKNKTEIDIIDRFDYETSIKIADALYCKFAFENLEKKVSKQTKLEMYSLADYVYSKDQTGISKSACLDAIVQFVNEGENLSDLVNMDKWELLNKIHNAEDF